MSTATANVTLTLTIDLENNGDAFWPAFRAELAKGIDGAFGRWPDLAKLAGRAHSVTLDLADIGEHAELEAALASLDGWYAGDERAPHPLFLDAQLAE